MPRRARPSRSLPMPMPMRRPHAWAGAWLIAAACTAGSAAGPALALGATASASASATVAWLPAAADADIERAFAQARDEKKPVLLYWGASWCPPCNQLQATLFNRQDFIERSRAFVAVHIDGDAPGAQKLGARFKVVGYPTLILFDPQGGEITRLPGEVDAPQVLELMQQGLAGGRPAQAVLADARAGKPLAANEWRLLAYYAWDTDEQQLVSSTERPALLARLAAACPASEGDTATRLWLQALAARGDEHAASGAAQAAATAAAPAAAEPANRERLQRLLADPARVRVQMDVLINSAAELARAVTPPSTAPQARQALLAAYDAALRRLDLDTSLSRADRLSTLIARVDLLQPAGESGAGPSAARARSKRLPPALITEIRERVAREDREITDGYERQAVITTAAYLLSQAGLLADSDALLQANLAKSHSPYYLMSALAGNAKRRGDKATALRWYESAYAGSVGPATRLQWGASYVSALIELAPQDSARIEHAVVKLFAETEGQRYAFYERSARSLQRVGTKLRAWGGTPERASVLGRLQQKLDGVCGRLEASDPQRSVCDGLLRPPPATGKASAPVAANRLASLAA